jgi:hypothetical protein
MGHCRGTWDWKGADVIFGFNTDIKFSDTIYHVQSEPRYGELMLETQVFVRGRCIGKHANSYADHIHEDGFSEQQVHELLKTQHRFVLEAIRQGKILELLGSVQPEPRPASVPLTLEWLNPESCVATPMMLRFRVMREGTPVNGAKLVSRLDTPAPVFSRAISDAAGTAEMRVLIDEREISQTVLLVQANFEGQRATRKFRIRRADT